ncbi:hydrogenase expression/formation protein HypE, partial [Thermodesulfovibrionales bacterium]|nr:hydrogenase expression/formation protein HypE [Thermodesulfovibrionales bacterium]
PGGNIGELAVNGTVNDLSMVGAKPLYLSAGFILEEGFPMDDLKTILSSMASASQKANVKIITGDTKVVDKGKGDGIFINTTGIGIIPNNIDLGPQKIKAGDKIIISGLIGSHGIAVLAKRHGVSLEPPILSDTLPLNGLVEVMLSITEDIRMMKDPTRGGIATTLKEIASDSGLCLTIHEDLLPISPGVIGACELLGLDHLYVANEGILIAVVPGNLPGNPDNVSGNTADRLLEGMRAHPAGRNAAIIGEVTDGDTRTRGMVLLKTAIGGTRVIDMLTDEQLPRIC